MLTDKAVRAAGAKDKACKVSDSGGLYLHVSTKSHKSWRFKYRFEKKELLLTLGTYPEVSLADARGKRDDARKVLRAGRVRTGQDYGARGSVSPHTNTVREMTLAVRSALLNAS